MKSKSSSSRWVWLVVTAVGAGGLWAQPGNAGTPPDGFPVAGAGEIGAAALPPARLPGSSGVPTIEWGGAGISSRGTAGPVVHASVNGTGGRSSVFLGNGAGYQRQRDFHLPLNGIDWFHERIYSSTGDGTPNWQGEQWWCNEMMNITGTAGDEDDNDCSIEMDPFFTLDFTNTATATWACDEEYLYTLTYSSGDDEFTLTRLDGYQWVFHDLNVADTAGMLKRIEDPYDNDWAFTYDGSDLDYIVVDVVAGNDHKITYDYFTSGDNDGMLQYIKVYKTTTVSDANLIGKITYEYHDSNSDGPAEFGSLNDLMTATTERISTTDGSSGSLDIEEVIWYRFYEGTYNASTNPGTDHDLRFVLYPENADRLNTDVGAPGSQSNSDWGDYANITYEYTSGHQVSQTDERLAGGGCGCGGGTSASTTTYTWTENTTDPGLDNWKYHCVADREDATRVITDVNSAGQILTWVVQDEDDGSPTYELIWHFDYGTSGETENRLTTIHNPSNCTAYAESTAPYAVTTSTSAGVVYSLDYDFATATYDGYVEKVQILEGTSGTANTLIAYGRTESARPDLATTSTVYESTGESDGRTTYNVWTFYDSGGAKVQPKQLVILRPAVSTAKNGCNGAALDARFLDMRTGAVRWTVDGEAYINFYAYDDETGVRDLTVLDVDTSSLMTVIDDNWDGVAHGDESNDDDVPTGFTRGGPGAALDIDSSAVIDWLGRTRKTTDAEGMITYYVYGDDVVKTYPAWDSSTEKTLLPIRITKTDKDGRAEESIALDTSFDPDLTDSMPDGTTSYANTDMVSWTKSTYNRGGALTDRDAYFNLPSSGDGTQFTNYYRTTYEYDSMGRREYVIQDVADESSYDREQVTQTVYDYLGRRTETKEGVSDNTHDISASKPTLNTTSKSYYDDPDSDSTPEHGEGDGNLSWVCRYYGTGANDHNDTSYEYDGRNRRCLTVPPAAPYTLVKYDHLSRVTATGTYSATTNLVAGGDPATLENGNRLSLSKTYYNEVGQVYKTERYEDPGDATPADALTTNYYPDRRRLIWAVDAPNTGVRFTKHDGAGRRVQSYLGTGFDANKYIPLFDPYQLYPNHLSDDGYMVQLTEYTLNEVGNVTKVITKELNHDDTDGMDLTNNDDYVRTYVYNWYDDANRLTDTANYGTYNGDGWKDNSTAPTYGASAPSRSDTVLVTTYAYDSAGRRNQTTDPKAVVTELTFDDLGRTLEKIEDKGTGDALNRTTQYQYNAAGSLMRIIADLSNDNTYSAGVWTMVGADVDQVTEYAYTDAQSAGRVKEIRYPTGDGTVGSAQADKLVFTYNVDGTVATRTDQNGSVTTNVYDTLRRKTEEELTTVGSYTLDGGSVDVDDAVRAVTWQYTSDGKVEYLTTYSDTTPDTSSYTDAVNQIKYHYNDAGKLIKQESEEVGAVDGSTKAVEYSYGTDYTSSGNYSRLNYREYPDDRKIWYGYTHADTAGTFQDTINAAFSRPGQIARDNAGSIGSILAQYDFNGIGRMVRRVHDEDTGMYGNDTKMDLWHGTTGEYAGYDRFGRPVDMKFTEFSGTPVDFDSREYTYDRNSNRTAITHGVFKADSWSLAYDDLNRLTHAERVVPLTVGLAPYNKEVGTYYKMDLLGNLTSDAGGLRVNTPDSTTVSHAVNATNEITSTSHSNQPGAPAIIWETFGSATIGTLWTTKTGTWNISSFELNVSALSSGEAIILTDTEFDTATYKFDVTFPTSSSTNIAGIVLCHDGDDDFVAVVLNRSTDKLEVYSVSGGSWGSALVDDDITIADETAYTVEVTRRQKRVEAKIGSTASLAYNLASDPGTGQTGFFSDKTSVTFDDFTVYLGETRDPLATRIVGGSDTSLSSGTLLVEGGEEQAGLAVVEGFSLDDYTVLVDVNLNSGADAEIWFRQIDPENAYILTLDSSGNITLDKLENGSRSTLDSDTYTTDTSVSVRIVADGTDLDAWVDGTQEIDTTDSTFDAGGVAFAGEKPKFDNLEIGLDENTDGDLADANDNVFVDEDFASSSASFTHCNAGNLVQDEKYTYTYDAWNRLVKVVSRADSDVTIHTASYDGRGRRLKKVVTNAGQYDGTVVFYYDGWKIIETRDGSGNLYQQFIHGTQYIDELVMMRVKDKGDLYVHQDANFNVIALTDLGGCVVQRNTYTPYGQMTVHQGTSYGDRDGDGIVNSLDKGTPGSTCTGTVTGSCRILDLDFDGDYDATDATAFDNLDQGLARHPAKTASGVDFPFGHQGLYYDAELQTYDNRQRAYAPHTKRFMQRDPLAIGTCGGAGYQDGLNAYSYVASNPTKLVDPRGTFPIPPMPFPRPGDPKPKPAPKPPKEPKPAPTPTPGKPSCEWQVLESKARYVDKCGVSCGELYGGLIIECCGILPPPDSCGGDCQPYCGALFTTANCPAEPSECGPNRVRIRGSYTCYKGCVRPPQ